MLARNGSSAQNDERMPQRGAGSALREASGTAFRAAGNVAAFRVSAKHSPGGGRYAKFGDSVDPLGAIADALRSPNAVFGLNNIGGLNLPPETDARKR